MVEIKPKSLKVCRQMYAQMYAKICNWKSIQVLNPLLERIWILATKIYELIQYTWIGEFNDMHKFEIGQIIPALILAFNK